MRLIEMITAVQSIFGDTSGAQITTTEITAWLNEGQRKLARDTQYIGQHAETDVISGQRAYDLPADVIIIERVELDGVRLEKYTLEQLDAMNSYQSTSEGTPTLYYMYGNQMYLYPTPTESGDGNLDIWYKRMPAELTSDDQVSELEPNVHDTLVRFALARAKEKDESYSDANLIMNGVEIEARQHYHESDQRAQDSYPVIRPAAGDEGWNF